MKGFMCLAAGIRLHMDGGGKPPGILARSGARRLFQDWEAEAFFTAGMGDTKGTRQEVEEVQQVRERGASRAGEPLSAPFCLPLSSLTTPAFCQSR